MKPNKNRNKGSIAVEKIVVTGIVLAISSGLVINYGSSMKATGTNAQAKTEKVFDKSLANGDNSDAAEGQEIVAEIELENETSVFTNMRPAYVGDGTGTYVNEAGEEVNDLGHEFADVWVQADKQADGTLLCVKTRSYSPLEKEFPTPPVKTDYAEGEIVFPDKIGKYI